MTRGPGRAVLALALIALVSSWGCAGHWAYRQAEEAAANGDWDLAVARYTKALDKDPKNIGYKIALENARIQASRLHYDKAREHLAANDFEKSVEELEIATKYDPANRSAADDLQILRDPEGAGRKGLAQPGEGVSRQHARLGDAVAGHVRRPPPAVPPHGRVQHDRCLGAIEGRPFVPAVRLKADQ